MTPTSPDPATLYLMVVAVVLGIWLLGDRAWALAHALSVRSHHRGAVTMKVVAAAMAAVIAVLSWRATPALASVIPRHERTIVAISPPDEQTTSAMTLHTLMASETPPFLGSGPGTHGGTHVVVRGDCLWKIARSLLIADGVTATGSATSALWRSIYEMNRDLIGPNPNLIFPGQVLDLPER